MRPLRLLLTAAAMLAATALSPARAQEPAAAPRTALPAISVTSVTEALVRDRVYASGLIGPVERVLVQPQIQGQAIEAILVEIGDHVTEGQVLARLSRTELDLQRGQLDASAASAEAAIAQAQAQLTDAVSAAAEAERVLTRTRALKDQGNVSQAGLDQANAAATSARARVAVAEQGLAAARAQLKLVGAQIADLELRLKRTEVVATVAGEVVERNAMVGAIASSAGLPMFVIVKDGELELMADVAETDLLKLAPEQPATLRFVGLDSGVAGRVRLVEPEVDAATRLGRVRIWIDHPEMVRTGMFAEAEIIAAERTTLVIPVSAVGGNTRQATAMAVSDGTVRQVDIIIGIRDGGLVEVVEGLSLGDVIVTKAGAFVRDGDRINPVPEGTAIAASN